MGTGQVNIYLKKVKKKLYQTSPKQYSKLQNSTNILVVKGFIVPLWKTEKKLSKLNTGTNFTKLCDSRILRPSLEDVAH